MPARPLVVLPAPIAPQEPPKKTGGSSYYSFPEKDKQIDRLTPMFASLQEAFEQRRTRLQLEAAGLLPEEVLVLETVDPVEDFFKAAARIPGFEWMGEHALEDFPPDDDFFVTNKTGEKKEEKKLPHRAYLVFSNQEALGQLLSLWEHWKAEKKFGRGLTKFRDLFTRLVAIRPWGTRDRLLETGVLDDWKERVASGAEILPCEIEMWFRGSADSRARAFERVSSTIESTGGSIVSTSMIETIGYHAILAKIPVGVIQAVIDDINTDISLFQCEQIQVFRAAGQFSAGVMDTTLAEEMVEGVVPVPGNENPVLAIFDGVPLQNHGVLDGRLIVDDPDGFEADVPVADRKHGTAMASLVVNGDLHAPDPLRRRVYIRPIMKSVDIGGQSVECVPEDTLVVDLVHRAVLRLFNGVGNNQPLAPTIKIINLSIGIADRHFDGALSPFARLLDWLAWQYKVLFVVSAGNHLQNISLNTPLVEFDDLEPEELENEVIGSLAQDSRHRQLLSPSESVNALTVGALADDLAPGNELGAPGALLPHSSVGLPATYNAQGMGFRRAIKPEILAPGGRLPLRSAIGSDPVELEPVNTILSPGQKVARPGANSGDINRVVYSRGTSNATAIVSRAGAVVYDVLKEIEDAPGGGQLHLTPSAIWLKALITHSADWGQAGERYRTVLSQGANSSQLKEYLSRFLGYGSVDVDKVRECTEYRVTALSSGVLSDRKSLIHSVPLPDGLSGKLGFKKLTITLAWLTPINPRHQNWKRAQLWFDMMKEKTQESYLQVKRQQADWKAAKRGTVQHEIFEGEKAAAFEENRQLKIRVNCVADAGALEDEIPYALVVSLQVAEDLNVNVYEEVVAKVQAEIEVT